MNPEYQPRLEEYETERHSEALLDEERRALALGSAKAPHPAASKLRKALLTVSAGLVLTGAFAEKTYGQRLSPAEGQEITAATKSSEQTGWEKRQAEREKYYEAYMAERGVKGLDLKKPVSTARCPCEQFGVYLKLPDKKKETVHLGDIYSKSWEFTDPEFEEKLRKLLEVKGISPKEGKELKVAQPGTDFQLEIAPEAKKLLKSWGGGMEKNQLLTGDLKKTIVFYDDTASVKIEATKDGVLLMTVANKDGSIDAVTVENRGGQVEIAVTRIKQATKK